MEEALFVNVRKSLCYLPGYVPDLFILKYFSFLSSFSNKFIKIFFNIFEY